VSPAFRFSLIFGAQFASLGAALPFVPAVLTAGGLSAQQVGLVLALGTGTRLLANPWAARIADRTGLRRTLALGAVLAGLLLPLLGWGQGLAVLLAVYVLHSAAVAPIVTLSDAAAIAEIRRRPFDYGRVRAVGSLTFILAALAAGQFVGLWGAGSALYISCAALLATGALALTLPPHEALPPAARGSMWEPLRQPAFRRLLPASALIQGSHAMYNGFSTLHWQAAGLSPGLVGALWGAGVVAEIALFVFGRRLVEKLGARGLAMVAAGSGVLRWSVTAVTVDPWLLFPIQLLHACTFGAMHLAAIRSLGALPPALGARAQALHTSLGVGLATGVMMVVAGPLYAALEGHAFWAMAGLCALGFVAATRLGR
jgi:PPP family 3-phenylpropionic acid transporter